MWERIKAFFASFVRNIAADPVSTAKGVVALASAGATCYGMATGKVPINSMSIGVASTLATSGVHALGTDATTGTTSPIAEKTIEVMETAAQLTPTALTIGDHYKAIREEAGKAQATISAVNEIAAALSAVATTDAKTTTAAEAAA